MGLKRSNLTLAAIADYERRIAPEYKQRDYVKEQADDIVQSVYTATAMTAANMKNMSRFLVEAKNWLLEECIYRIYNEALDVCLDESNRLLIDEGMRRGVVHQFVIENGGASKMLRRFYDQNVLLSEINQCVEHYYDLIVEATKNKETACKDADGRYKIPSDVQDKFYRELDTADFGDVSMQISTRVIDAIDNFVTDNSETMNNIRDILQTTKDRVAASKQTIKSNNEAAIAENAAKRQIAKVKQNRKMNVFSYMIEATAKNIMKDDSLRESFLNKAMLDIDKIKAYVTTTYTMMETANTMQLITVDENYISNVINAL